MRCRTMSQVLLLTVGVSLAACDTGRPSVLNPESVRADLGAGERTTFITPSPSVPEPKVAATIKVGRRGQVVSVMYAAGSVWVSGYDVRGEYVLRVDPETNDVVARIPAAISTCSAGSCGIAFGDGAIWTTGLGLASGGGRDAVLQRIDPTTNEVTQTVGLDGSYALDVAVDSNGVWVSVFHDLRAPAEVVRVDPETGTVVARIPLRTADARDVVTAGGGIWVLEYEVTHVADGGHYEAYSYSRIDASTNEVVATVPSFGVLSPGGNVVWGTRWRGLEASLIRLDPVTGEQLGSAVPVGRRINLLGAGNGGVWFSVKRGGVVYLERFEPATDSVDVSLAGVAPQDIAFSDSAIWALNFNGTLSRIDVVM
jgi:hypothetical protein